MNPTHGTFPARLHYTLDIKSHFTEVATRSVTDEAP
jgi:hypothetical protein